MPQFDPASFPSQLFWLLVCFGALYYLMSRIALPRIAEVLDERQRRIDGDLEKAAAIKTQVEAAIKAYDKSLLDAKNQAQTLLRAAHDEVSHLVQSRSKEVASRLAEQVRDGEARIAAARNNALGEIRDIAAEVAVSAAGRIGGMTVDAVTARAAVDNVIGEHP